jgi:hypothetical protein
MLACRCPKREVDEARRLQLGDERSAGADGEPPATPPP